MQLKRVWTAIAYANGQSFQHSLEQKLNCRQKAKRTREGGAEMIGLGAR